MKNGDIKKLKLQLRRHGWHTWTSGTRFYLEAPMDKGTGLYDYAVNSDTGGRQPYFTDALIGFDLRSAIKASSVYLSIQTRKHWCVEQAKHIVPIESYSDWSNSIGVELSIKDLAKVAKLLELVSNENAQWLQKARKEKK